MSNIEVHSNDSKTRIKVHRREDGLYELHVFKLRFDYDEGVEYISPDGRNDLGLFADEVIAKENAERLVNLI